jgi:hypothetical protein
MNPWERVIWWTNVVLTAAVLINLWRIGLVRRYKLFYAYQAADFLQSAVLIFVPYRTTLYAQIYFPTQTVKICFAAFLLIEIYSVVLEDRPALARFGKSFVGYVLLAAALIAASGLMVHEPASAGKQVLFTRELLVERTLTSTMVIFEILVASFLSWFPVRIRRNELLIIGGFLVWFLSRSALTELTNLFQGQRALQAFVNSTHLFISCGCLCAWLFGLRREGENRTAVVASWWNARQANGLLLQLDALNDVLSKARSSA